MQLDRVVICPCSQPGASARLNSRNRITPETAASGRLPEVAA